MGGYWWPEKVPLRGSVRAYEEVYEYLAYRVCENGDFVLGVEKIALYAHDPHECLHAARQTISGAWTSKMGDGADVEHSSPQAIESEKFGRVVTYMARSFGLPRQLPPPRPVLVLPLFT